MEDDSNKRILIVEDDTVVVELYRKKLQSEGYEVCVARDGLDAMKNLPALKPGVVLLDLMMPKFNGADVLRFLRSHKDLKSTKVIIFTNAYMTDLAQEATRVGADRSLLKSSTTPAELLKTIQELTGDAPLTDSTKPADDLLRKSFEIRSRQEFLNSAPATSKAVRELSDAFANSAKTSVQSIQLAELHRKIHFLASTATAAGISQIASVANALEALLFELQQRPKNITPSTIPTIRSAVDLLDDLFAHARAVVNEPPVAPSTLLVVEDDTVCNRALVHALGRARLKSTSATDPFAAFKLMETHRFDLILLDYLMPRMDGIELCTKLRCLPGYEKIPVIFVTTAKDFRQRAQGILKQGDEVITKPIFPPEFTLKVLTILLRNQLETKLATLATEG